MSKVRNFIWWCGNHPNIVWLKLKSYLKPKQNQNKDDE